jgi:hypothetical protein
VGNLSAVEALPSHEREATIEANETTLALRTLPIPEPRNSHAEPYVAPRVPEQIHRLGFVLRFAVHSTHVVRPNYCYQRIALIDLCR